MVLDRLSKLMNDQTRRLEDAYRCRLGLLTELQRAVLYAAFNGDL